MILLKDYDNVRATDAGEFVRLPADGYVCKIINVKAETSKAGNPMLVFAVDIAEGEFAGYFIDQYKRRQQWNKDGAKYPNDAVYRQLIFDTHSGKLNTNLKGMLTAIENSNPGFSVKGTSTNNGNGDFSFNEETLKGKLCGFVFGEEEYINGDGTTGVAIRIKYPRSVENIRSGKFRIPELKKAEIPGSFSNTPTNSTEPNATFDNLSSVENEDVPF